MMEARESGNEEVEAGDRARDECARVRACVGSKSHIRLLNCSELTIPFNPGFNIHTVYAPRTSSQAESMLKSSMP